MSSRTSYASGRLARHVEELSARRTEARRAFFDEWAEPLARLCHRIAERFARGGRLLAIAHAPQACSDARHVAVEFVHPVIVGKRALPALALTGGADGLRRRVALVVQPADVAIAFGAGAATACAVAHARREGCLTVAFERVGAEWELEAATADPFVRQELAETTYHVLWELVHVFFEHRGLLTGRDTGPLHDVGESGFLYPFLAEGERDLESVLDSARRSIVLKAQETEALCAQTLDEGRDVLIDAAVELREHLDAGGTVLAIGNGGSATDAMDAVADFREPPHGWVARRALDLTEDPAILTAIANDVGVESIFRRQLIAYARAGDALLALSTSGGSANVLAALDEARAQRLATIAMVGYDGGRIATERLADHVVVARSQHIPRIQEAQASACHVLRELVEMVA